MAPLRGDAEERRWRLHHSGRGAVPVAAVTCALVARLAAPDHMLPIAMGAFVLFLIGRFVYDSRKAKIDA